MIQYEDLLGVPYKEHGRSIKEGFDCYGLVIECAKRAGTPLRDIEYECVTIDAKMLTDYISSGINVFEVPTAEVGDIVECEYSRTLHIGYVVSPEDVLHAVRSVGVRISPLLGLKVKRIYRIKGLDK